MGDTKRPWWATALALLVGVWAIAALSFFWHVKPDGGWWTLLWLVLSPEVAAVAVGLSLVPVFAGLWVVSAFRGPLRD